MSERSDDYNICAIEKNERSVAMRIFTYKVHVILNENI